MEQVVIDTAMEMWRLALKRADGMLAALSDQSLQAQVAPGRNRAIYILGHLTTVNDGMMPLLRFGPRLYPSLEEPFLIRPDKEVPLPEVSELRGQWKTVNSTLDRHFADLTPAQWFERHGNITEGEFLANPQRNRLGILLNRTNHISFHLGQLVFLLPPGATRGAR